MQERKERNLNIDKYTAGLNRRDFLKTSGRAALGAAAALGAGAGFSPAFAAKEKLTVNGMPAVMLGRTGLKVTKVSFGGMMINDPPVLLRAIEKGIVLIHTAPGYSNGNSMKAFGRVLKDKSVRDKVVLALKERPENLDECLKVLNTDYVDILVPPLHSMKAIQNSSIPENFEKVKKAGKAGFMGFACHNNMTQVLNKARELGYFDVTLMSYSHADNPEFIAAAKAAKEAGIGIMAMKGLPKSVSRNAKGADVDTCASLCGTMVGRQHAHTVLASMSSFQMVDMYHSVISTKLSYYNPALEERYWAEQRGSYCAMCGMCDRVSPDGLDIPRILRYRMYYKDYGLTEYARSRYAELGVGALDLARVNYASCESICTRGLPLRSMLEETHSLLA